MGRVSRYKKVKACDPYSKKNKGQHAQGLFGVGGEVLWGTGDNGQKKKKRSLKAQADQARKLKRRRAGRKGDDDHEGRGVFNLSYRGKDEFDLKDLMGSLKKEAPPKNLLQDDVLSLKASASTTKKDGTKNEPKRTEALNESSEDPKKPTIVSVEEETKEARFLKISEKTNPSLSAKTEIAKRQEGESKNAFRRRLQRETRQSIRDSKSSQVGVNTEKKQKKKEFLKAKKQKRKKGQKNKGDNDDDYDDYGNRSTYESDSLVTGERAAAAAASEVTHAFGDQVERPPEFRQLPRGAHRIKKASSKDGNGRSRNEMEEAEKRTMEIMRQRVQAQYALMKAKRRAND